MAIRAGVILKLGKESELPAAEETLDGRNRLVLPGAIDAHVHLRDQQLSYKETFETGTAAAIAGGVTTVLDMPNNDPPTNTLSNLRGRMRLAKERIHCNVGFYAAPNRDATETRQLLRGGAIGLKVNMLKPIGPSLRNSELEESLREASNERKVTTFHAEDGATVQARRRRLERSGRRTYQDFSLAHPPLSEISAVEKALILTHTARCQAHLAHISCQAALLKILSAKKARQNVTSEATPHHLFLDSETLNRIDGLGIMTPPLRSLGDRTALWKAFARGLIDICASDHAPHTWNEKTGEDVWDVSPGVSGLDIFMPLLLTRVVAGEISLKRLVEAISERPAEIFSLAKRGSLEPGHHADFVLIDMKARGRVRGEDFKSKAKFTPFEGWPLTASVVATFVNGKCVISEGEILGKPGFGSVIRSHGNEAKISPRQHAR